jgi:tryptophan 2,3-dioxygenase
MDYGTYLKLDALLALQQPQSKPEQSDELLFIVVHQASELWFKVILRELDAFVARLEANDITGAIFVMQRLNSLVQIVTDQLSALDTLPPQRFAKFRGDLGTSSGSQSAQFRAIEAASGLRDPAFLHAIAEGGEPPELVKRWLARPTLQSLFEKALAANGETAESIYTRGDSSQLFLLAEALLEYDQAFGRWRFLHVQLVERIIGPATSGTGGTLGAKYLSRTLSMRFFPALWEVRSRVFGGAGGGA